MRYTLFLVGILLLTSCGGGEQRPSPENALGHGAAAENLTASMKLKLLESNESEWVLGIFVQNPEEIPIQSIRSWVQFDSSQVRIRNLTIEDGRFTLFAPGERTIDLVEGFVKIGGAVREPIRDTEIFFASFTVRAPISSDLPVLTFYDWRADGNGHTAVLTLERDGVLNVLHIPPSIEL